MQIYLVYRYEGFYMDTSRHLVAGFIKLDSAKQYVEEAAHNDIEYRKSMPDRYLISTPVHYEWVETEDNELHYKWGEERHITMDGTWLTGWGRYAVVPFEVEE